MDARRIPFTPEDESRIASAATWGKIVAICSIAGGVISLVVMALNLGSLPESAPPGFAGAALVPLVAVGISILLNAWLFQGSEAFRKVALTDEADQQYLLEGFRKLRLYFMVQVILMLIAVMFGFLAAAFAAMQ